MGWFDEQLRQRSENDNEVFEDSFIKLAGSILGNKAAAKMNDERLITKAAVDEILKFYHHKPREIPDKIKDFDEQLEYILRPHGIMRRNIILSKGWYKDAFDPMLAFLKNDGTSVALLPRGLTGYYYKDFTTGKNIVITYKNANDFEAEAFCFYKPLPLKKLKIKDLFVYLFGCIKAGDYTLVIGATLIAQFIGLMLPKLTHALTGPILLSGNKTFLVGVTIFLMCTAISSQLLGSLRNLINSRILTKTQVSVEAAVMMRLMSLPATFFKDYSSGELSSRASSVNSLCSTLIGSVFMTSLTSLSSLLYITAIFQYAKALVIPSLVIIILTVVLTAVSSIMQIKISRMLMEKGAKQSGLTYSLITGVQKLKLSGSEKRAFARWAEGYSKCAELQYNPPMFLKVNKVITTAVALTGSIVIYYLSIQSGISSADYLAFNTAYTMVSNAFTAMAGVALTVARIPPILDMAKPILEAEPEISDGKEVLSSISGTIELNNVSFRYNDKMPYIIDNLSLKIRSGEYVAIVGTTGCGKTTLVRLLLGFEKPEKGAIYYDSKDMTRLDLKSLRQRIGTVTQNGGLFQGDIYSNIVISAPQLSLEDAWKAAETACIADDIRAMPMGMNTLIAEGQGGISGGQKQRLMIARAIAPKPKVLIFDEATSALDNRTQKQVSEALDALKCTRIIIAHRLSTIRRCDRILYLEGGRIVEDGNYDQLIALGGKFAALVERQRLDI